jgi:DNA-binding transcriptional ArsR family regulator
LSGGERQVGDIVERARIHQSGVSRHLRILHEAGFVSKRPDGQRRLYSLRPEPFRELDEWLAKYRGLWEARAGPVRGRARRATEAASRQTKGVTA